jgi:hypothetical protein
MTQSRLNEVQTTLMQTVTAGPQGPIQHLQRNFNLSDPIKNIGFKNVNFLKYPYSQAEYLGGTKLTWQIKLACFSHLNLSGKVFVCHCVYFSINKMI